MEDVLEVYPDHHLVYKGLRSVPPANNPHIRPALFQFALLPFLNTGQPPGKSLKFHKGYRDVMNILETIRQDLLTTRFLERKYKLEMPFKWYLFEDQPWPVFFGQIETVWETGRPLMPGTGNIYGRI
jgi:hypothetical protein